MSAGMDSRFPDWAEVHIDSQSLELFLWMGLHPNSNLTQTKLNLVLGETQVSSFQT